MYIKTFSLRQIIICIGYLLIIITPVCVFIKAISIYLHTNKKIKAIKRIRNI